MERHTGRLRRVDRIQRSEDFRRLGRRGRRRASGCAVLLYLPREGAERSRLGITASRKVGNAVTRNRVKRCTREWFRRARGELTSPMDIVVIARRAAAELGGRELAGELDRLVEAAGIGS